MTDHAPAEAHGMPSGLTSGRRARLQLMQALEDAIQFRLTRVMQPCPDCGSADEHCDDHACDLMLIGDYQRSLARAAEATELELLPRGS
jgi:hypothetical protein